MIKLILLGFFLTVSSFAAPKIPIQDFHMVDPGIYRGARPDLVGMLALKQSLGVNTIINLEDETKFVAREGAWAKALDIKYISVPLNAMRMPKKVEMDRILAELTNPNNGPVYLHCKHGHDRTGLAFGLYRVFVDGWSASRSYSEMLQLHFHPLLLPLQWYFVKATRN